VRPYINDAGLILVMSVEPGRGGQKFMPESLDKVHAIKEMTAPMGEGRRPLIEIDGGINAETGRAAAEAGADILVAGSYIFGHDDMAARLESLQGEKR
jgi:ribulose-phosphate 3-epimerase